MKKTEHILTEREQYDAFCRVCAAVHKRIDESGILDDLPDGPRDSQLLGAVAALLDHAFFLYLEFTEKKTMGEVQEAFLETTADFFADFARHLADRLDKDPRFKSDN